MLYRQSSSFIGDAFHADTKCPGNLRVSRRQLFSADRRKNIENHYFGEAGNGTREKEGNVFRG